MASRDPEAPPRSAAPAALCALLLLAGCGEELPAEPTPSGGGQGSEPAATLEEALEPDRPAPAPEPEPEPEPLSPPPTRAQIDVAREQCGDGYMAVLRGELDEGDRQIAAALAVLRRVEEPADRNALGACLYNAARLAEERLDIGAARERYDESLQVRPHPVARRRRRRLGERDPHAPDERAEMLANQLRRSGVAPCRSGDCVLETRAMTHSGGGRLLRAGVVAVGTEEQMQGMDAEHELYLGFTGPRGGFRWGPRLWPEQRGGYLRWQEPTVAAAFRPARPDRPWLLFVRIAASWMESCSACEGQSGSGGESIDLAICELTDEAARCSFVEELRQCQGETSDLEEYRPCNMDRRRYVTFDAEGLEVHGSDPATSAISSTGSLAVGTYPWTVLFPEPSAEAPPAESPVDSPVDSPRPKA